MPLRAPGTSPSWRFLPARLRPVRLPAWAGLFFALISAKTAMSAREAGVKTMGLGS
jgi:hypothetical protein